MEQTFNDLCNERKRETDQSYFSLVLWMFVETATGIIQEHILLITHGDTMKNIISNPKSAALIGFLLTLPFMLLNTIANNEIEPFFTFFKINTAGGFWDHPIGHIAVIVALLLLPFGAVISIRPMFQKGADGKRKFHLMNILLAVIMLALFVLISGALISEIYRCNVLQIPNCD